MNYKIKANGNIEELISLFIALGCKYFNHTVTEKNYMIVENGKGFFCKLKSNFKKSECREISIDQLKDMVVLKRNDVVDVVDVEQDNVNQPSHYNKGGVECIDAIQSSMTHEAFCGYLKGNVQKYMWRYENKGGVESLEKAQWYLNKLIEVRNENSSED